MVIQRKVTVRYNKDMYIAVDAAIEGKVRFLRVHRAFEEGKPKIYWRDRKVE